jgi:superfamily II DNA/RNA helicase
MIQSLINGDNLESDVPSILSEFHTHGPVDSFLLEKLAYYKRYNPERLAAFEKKLLYIMGLFYKTDAPESLLEEVYSIFARSIKEDTGKDFTPVQAGVYNSIHDNRYYSFSAPTSAGKSYLFRQLILETVKDIVIVVPSRALISEYYYEIINLVDKNVLVLQFIEDVNTALIDRRIFIVTPERAVQLFKQKDKFNVELFLFDEAQLSEEEFRGLRFDALVRRVDRIFPDSKKVFAHPFVSNPEAQLLKHNFSEHSSSHSYSQQAVGKIFLHYEDGKFTHFSPNIDCPHLVMEGDIASRVLENKGTMLVYISKNKIYDGTYRLQFGQYIELCLKLDDKKAVRIIKELKEFIGAEDKGTDKHSNLIELMERGVVTHHGSMPLKARLIVEQFIKEGLARICFATSTLNQGINMPFDVVWIDNFHRVKELTLKNLIGRSGRTKVETKEFDYGYTIVKRENVRTFTERYKDVYSLSNESRLDCEVNEVDEDVRDVVEAIKNDEFNDDLHLTNNQVERIEKSKIWKSVEFVLDTLMNDGKPISGVAYYSIGDRDRKKLKTSFKTMYMKHLRRNTLEVAEASVLSAAIPIMLWHVQGRSFSQIVAIRHAFLTQKSERDDINSRLKSGTITDSLANSEYNRLTIRYSQIPSHLPNKRLTRGTSFPWPDVHISRLDYDSLVYDTYDYLDKVISQSLTDPICAVLEIYYDKTGDNRAFNLSRYIRYGTNDDTDIWLMKYGFGLDDIDWIKEHVVSVDSSRIYFSESINEIPAEKREVVERYL